jgi:hypothetical protein
MYESEYTEICMAKPDLEQIKRRFDNKEMSVERTIDAMKIYIDYESKPTKWICHEHESDFIFCEPPGMHTQLKSSNPISLDPYLVREEFLSLITPMEALTFLNRIGDFWPLPAITWKEIERWQDFLKIVAEEDFPSKKNASTEAAAYAAMGIPHGFFTFDEKIDSIALDHMIAARPQESRKDLVDRRAELSLRLPKWFAIPPKDAKVFCGIRLKMLSEKGAHRGPWIRDLIFTSRRPACWKLSVLLFGSIAFMV